MGPNETRAYSNSSLGCEVAVPLVAKQQPASLAMVQQLERLATRAEQLAELVRGKLNSVMTSDCPQPSGCLNEKDREWPPLFAEMRSYSRRISGALEAIEYDLSRTDL